MGEKPMEENTLRTAIRRAWELGDIVMGGLWGHFNDVRCHPATRDHFKRKYHRTQPSTFRAHVGFEGGTSAHYKFHNNCNDIHTHPLKSMPPNNPTILLMATILHQLLWWISQELQCLIQVDLMYFFINHCHHTWRPSSQWSVFTSPFSSHLGGPTVNDFANHLLLITENSVNSVHLGCFWVSNEKTCFFFSGI